jgi:ABC-type multidrug transport system ATPase subunit
MRPLLELELKAITISWPGRPTPLIIEIDIKVEPGGMTALTGPSGMGKSSLLRVVMGFMVPSKGTVLIGGEAMDSTNVWRLRRQMSYVPQEPRMGSGIVEDALRRPFKYKSSGEAGYDIKRVKEVFLELGLDKGLLSQELRELSGGERQRLAIAIALLLDRSILVLDEPTSALDKASRVKVREALRRRNLTLFASSHDDILLEMAGNVIDLSREGVQG